MTARFVIVAQRGVVTNGEPCGSKPRKVVWRSSERGPVRYVVAEPCGSPPGYTNPDNINLLPGLKHPYLGVARPNPEAARSRHERTNDKSLSFSSFKFQPDTVSTGKHQKTCQRS